jgi:hypothetical protein
LGTDGREIDFGFVQPGSVLPTTKYGGQFLTDIIGLSGGNVLVMQGTNGQEVAMDMDSSKIPVINAGKSDQQSTKKI